jgi:DNA end-binding protein Ku
VRSGAFGVLSLRMELAWSTHIAARSIWNGKLALGKTTVGVKLFAAIEDQTVHFHLLHAEDQERVEQRMLNPKTGEVRAGDEIHKGYEIKPGTFVLLDPKELAKLEPPPSKVIEVQHFVPAAEIEPVWYERPYFVGPDGKSPEYFALARVLAERGLAGVVRWVMRKHAYHGALRAHGDYLTLSTLHSREEVVAAPRVTPATRVADARELAMAEQLVTALAGEFDASEFHDEHRARVLELIAAKAKGKTLKPPPRVRARAPKLLGDALEQSLKLLQKSHKPKERLSA